MSSIIEEKYYTRQIAKISNDFRVNELFSSMPKSSIDAYKKSLIYNAVKEYSKSNKVLPNNFFSYVDQSLRQTSPLRAYKKHEEEFTKMEEFFNVEKKYFVELLKRLTSNNSAIKYKAVEEIKTFIRDYNSKSKGHFIKLYNKEKIKKLEEICYRKEQIHGLSQKSEEFDFIKFINDLKIKKPYTYYNVLELMNNASNIVIDDIIPTVFEYINDNKPLDYYLNIFGIYKPINYDPNYIKDCKTTNRLHDNFEKLFNSESYDNNYKKLLVQYINNKIKGIDNNKIEARILINDKINAEVAYSLLRRINGFAKLKDGYIHLYSPIKIDTNRINKFKNYEEQLYNVNYFIRFCFKLYTSYLNKQNENNKINSNENINNIFFDDSSFEINAESYIHYNKISNLISGIDLDKLHNLDENEFNSLKSLLNDKYLMFAYLIGNIELNDILLIINNYSGIINHLKRYNIDFNDLDNILRIAKTFRYVNDLDIALIGYDNLVKIINYNQFCGLDVNDEAIKSRIHKAEYLSVKSEQVNTSSLPYDVDVSSGNLKLKRYLNNDPEIFVSGIETKTCFFVSVNENDFFFYSLLNKNGFVVKIVDENDNFIARASCFRRNNILMINGIRLKNNEINPKNKEQQEIMKKVVKLIEMMADKIIYSTTADECPIDYVVCNKAGILENNEFEDKYEFVDFKIIREPINIYGDDWKEFISINEKENDNDLLQEAPINPKKSFTTDFGDNYSLILLKSRHNMGLLRPSNISLKDQDSTYARPKSYTKVYVNDEINSSILEKINRIRALNTFNGSLESQEIKQKNFKLLNNTNNISKVIVADTWIGIIYKDDTKEFAYSILDNNMSTEIQKYASFKTVDTNNKSKSRKPIFKKN